MFQPNLDAELRKKAGRDLFGKESFGEPIPIRCGVVDMAALMDQTSVRADSTGSRGAAQELVLQSKILVPEGTPVDQGDLLVVLGFTVEVIGVHPRVDTQGNTDHLELRAKIRQEL